MELAKWKNSNLPSFSGLLDDFFSRELSPIMGRMRASSPAVNIRETNDKYVLEVAAPGMAKEDFNIEVTPSNVLVISSEKREERKEDSEQENDKGRFSLREFSYSSFSRSFTLPDTVDAENIKASYRDGVLEVGLPKRAESELKQKRTIQID